MCGISGYIGENQKLPNILLDILKKLEYRGYDSAGVGYICKNTNNLVHKKAIGELKNLFSKLPPKSCTGGIGIAHTRWATHGKPSVANAHPHKVGNIVLVHNGIIENYKQIKDFLIKQGYKFSSQTDTETIAALIDYYHSHQSHPIKQAIKSALSRLQGAYALLVFSLSEPDKLFAIRVSSPLVMGIIEEGEYVFASDALALIDKTKRMLYLSDYDLLQATSKGYTIENFKTNSNSKSREELLQLSPDAVSKEGYTSYMQKEIYEQPESIKSSILGRISNLQPVLGGLANVEHELTQAKEVHFIACGTSYNAAASVVPVFEKLNIPIKLNYASEARYSLEKIRPNTVAFFISQSGETADTLAALKKYKSQGALCLGITNTVASSIARLTHAGVYNHAGPEISVASTKAFTSQIAVLTLVAAKMLQLKNYQKHKAFISSLLKDLQKMPKILEKEIPKADKVMQGFASKIANSKSLYTLARGFLTPLAYEAALKIKEISYIHAEGYPAGELKHGPIALIEKGFPVVTFPQPVYSGKKLSEEEKLSNELFEKTTSNIQEVLSRGAEVFVISSFASSSSAAAKQITKITKNIHKTPTVHPYLQTIVYAPALQLLSLHIAEKLKRNVDKPRNLAKSVTVE